MSSDKRTAFMQAYAPCHEAFARYCAALAYGRMDVQDLMQDVLLTAFQQFERIRRKDELLHYLIRAARNRSVSIWRVGKRNEAIAEKHTERLRDRGASAELLVDVGILYKELDHLPAAQREALVLFEVSGLSMAEIAQVQGTSEGNVKTRVSRARAALRERLEGRGVQHAAGVFNTFITLLP